MLVHEVGNKAPAFRLAACTAVTFSAENVLSVKRSFSNGHSVVNALKSHVEQRFNDYLVAVFQ